MKSLKTKNNRRFFLNKTSKVIEEVKNNLKYKP
jgi:hypothetical protein